MAHRRRGRRSPGFLVNRYVAGVVIAWLAIVGLVLADWLVQHVAQLLQSWGIG